MILNKKHTRVDKLENKRASNNHSNFLEIPRRFYPKSGLVATRLIKIEGEK